MTRFLAWRAVTAASIAGVALTYQGIGAMRRRLDHGLERVEQIAGGAQRALQHAERALEQTAHAAREVRHTIA